MKTIKPIQILSDKSIEKIERAVRVLEDIHNDIFIHPSIYSECIADLKEIITDVKE